MSNEDTLRFVEGVPVDREIAALLAGEEGDDDCDCDFCAGPGNCPRYDAPPTLAGFLLARIAEDDRRARLGQSDPGGGWLGARDRDLAECEAKRGIVELHSTTRTTYPPRFDEFDPVSVQACGGCGSSDVGRCRTLRALSLAYASHPCYRDEWRP